MPVTNAQAQLAIAAALRHAERIGVRVTAVVADEGGHLIALSRMDGAQHLSPQVAEAKAVAAALLQRNGDAVARIYTDQPGAFTALSELSRVPLFPGLGSLVIEQDGRVVGAIAVSGATSEQDRECAQAGLNALSG